MTAEMYEVEKAQRQIIAQKNLQARRANRMAQAAKRRRVEQEMEIAKEARKKKEAQEQLARALRKARRSRLKQGKGLRGVTVPSRRTADMSD